MLMRIPIRGTMALLAAAAIVGVTLLWLPAYRMFFVISVGIGVVEFGEDVQGVLPGDTRAAQPAGGVVGVA